MLTAMAGAIVNVILNFTLIPRHGAMGAAVATLISYLCTYAIRAYDTSHYVKFNQHHVRVTINTSVLLAQACVMVMAPIYWQYVQIGCVAFMLIFNGKGIFLTIVEIAKKVFSKKAEKI